MLLLSGHCFLNMIALSLLVVLVLLLPSCAKEAGSHTNECICVIDVDGEFSFPDSCFLPSWVRGTARLKEFPPKNGNV